MGWIPTQDSKKIESIALAYWHEINNLPLISSSLRLFFTRLSVFHIFQTPIQVIFLLIISRLFLLGMCTTRTPTHSFRFCLSFMIRCLSRWPFLSSQFSFSSNQGLLISVLLFIIALALLINKFPIFNFHLIWWFYLVNSNLGSIKETSMMQIEFLLTKFRISFIWRLFLSSSLGPSISL
jgi:hypothetical protein